MNRGPVGYGVGPLAHLLILEADPCGQSLRQDSCSNLGAVRCIARQITPKRNGKTMENHGKPGHLINLISRKPT